ncbi:MAG TPA: TlpA disulfide reductase family protein [Terriglobales bacterium]|nr:TlpA disulfide reductase family protein [Terriglobales bacterium]
MKRDPFVIVIVAVVIALMLVVGLRMARRTQPSPASQMKGDVAPDFTLQSLDGRTVHLSDYRGKAVLLNFWATWCAPCKIEMPWFVELQKEYGPEGLQIVGVAMDDASPKEIADFAKEMGVNYPVLIGKEAVGDAYGGVQFLPESFYIDRNGKVLDKAFGLKGRGEIEVNIKKIIASSAVAQK